MNLLLQFIIATIATLTFAILFHAPSQHYVRCGIIGGIGWIVQLLIQQNGGSLHLACFFAALVLTVLSRFVAIWFKTPVIVFLTAAIFPLVPGAGIYHTAYSLFSGSLDKATVKGLETLMVAGAISLGILFGSTVPQIAFQKVVKLTQQLFRIKKEDVPI